MQLAHAGRKASTAEPWKGGGPVTPADGGWEPIWAPSAIPFREGWQVPRALTIHGIKDVVNAFASAAGRVLSAGGRIVEIHAAHGYLIHEFLSPLSNHRADQYGGSFENRTRILRDVVDAVRGVWPERLPVFVRISSTDWTDGGWTIEDSVALARQLEPHGVDLIDCSSGARAGREDSPAPGLPGAAFAERIRRDGRQDGRGRLITERTRPKASLSRERRT
jgi:2,4-dienoyl-CoA reductase-like NADH-dependent reductase (Old Yellow Enzyme family)